MNIQKHKSVAVRKEDHETLTALCGKEHRGPAQYMSLLIKKEIERRARLKKMTPEAYRTKIMKEVNGKGNLSLLWYKRQTCLFQMQRESLRSQTGSR